MKTIEQLAVEAELAFPYKGRLCSGWEEEFDIRSNVEKFAALVLAEHSPSIIALARKLAMEEAAAICEKHVNNATDWDSSYWDQCAGACAHDIRMAASKGETP